MTLVRIQRLGSVTENRVVFLKALRSGVYQKGPFVKGQDEPPPSATGFCAVGLPYTIFLGNNGPIVEGLKRVLGLKRQDLTRIQNEWNDSPLTFSEIADRIETEIFTPANQDKGE